MHSFLLSEIVQNVATAGQSLGSFIYRYQSIFGGVVNAIVATLIAIFVTRRIVERGRLNFYRTREVRDYISKENDRYGALLSTTFEEAFRITFTTVFDIQNGSGIRKLMRGFVFGLKEGKRTEYLFRGLETSWQVELGNDQIETLSLDPKALATVVLRITFSPIETEQIKRHNPTVIFGYRDERGKLNELSVGRIVEKDEEGGGPARLLTAKRRGG